jgi:D-glycero-D-manno-heptose 1,7-bisphosphate phosphatase
MSSGVAPEEYSALRDELQTILQTRFNILTANIALVGVLVGIAFQDTATALRPWLPLMMTAFLLPSLVTNYYLSRHFTRIGGYLLARFEQQDNGFLFMTALDHFKQRDTHYRAYSWPMLLTYVLLVLASYGVAAIANFGQLGNPAIRTSLIAQTVITLPVLLAILHRTNKGRATDMCFDDWWRGSIAEAESRWARSQMVTGWVYVDRDGVINENVRTHVRKLDEFRFIPGSIEALVALHKAGFGIIVVTNQPVIDEGLTTVEELAAMHELLRNAVESAGGSIEGIYYCPHSEHQSEPGCDCRKPRPGLLNEAAADHNIDLHSAYVVGDQITDIQAGKRVGATTILVRTGRGEDWLSRQDEWSVKPDAIVEDLAAAARMIVAGQLPS